MVREVEIHEEMGHRVASSCGQGHKAPAACGHPPLCIGTSISKATVTIVSAPSFKNRSTVSKQALQSSSETKQVNPAISTLLIKSLILLQKPRVKILLFHL